MKIDDDDDVELMEITHNNANNPLLKSIEMSGEKPPSKTKRGSSKV